MHFLLTSIQQAERTKGSLGRDFEEGLLLSTTVHWSQKGSEETWINTRCHLRPQFPHLSAGSMITALEVVGGEDVRGYLAQCRHEQVFCQHHTLLFPKDLTEVPGMSTLSPPQRAGWKLQDRPR